MDCVQPVKHTIRRRDTLFHLAYYYKTTEERIIALNPGIDPLNLQIGHVLTICPNTANMAPARSGMPAANRTGTETSSQVELEEILRKLWEEHIMFTRMVVMSVVDDLADDDVVTARLLQNPGQMGAVFGRYYGQQVADNVANLFTQHLVLAKDWMTLLKNRQEREALQKRDEWYRNADEIAGYLASINPNYDQEMMRQMKRSHNDTVKAQVESRMAGNYVADVAAYDTGEELALDMADYWAHGIEKQFPAQFR